MLPRAIACFSFDNMAEAADVGAGVLDGPRPDGSDPSLTIGYPNLFALLERQGISATFFIEGWNGEHHPDAVAEIVRRGHELGMHGWTHESWAQLDPAQEQQLAMRATAALEQAAGVRPTGFRAPGGARSSHTESILRDLGYGYDASLGDGMRPTMLPSGLAQVPFVWAGVDGFYYLRPEPVDPQLVRDRWLRVLDDTAARGGLFLTICHAFITGVDNARLAALDAVMDAARADKRITILTAGEVAQRLRDEAAANHRRAPTQVPSPTEAVDFLANTPFETPPEEGGSSGRTEELTQINTNTVRAEEAPSSQGSSRSPARDLSTLSEGEGKGVAVPLERHPWNRSFTWQSRRSTLRRITDQQARDYDEQGFFVLEDAFDPATVRDVINAIDPLDQQTLEFLRTQEGERFLISDAKTITFTPHLVLRSSVLRAFCAGPVFQDLVHDLIGDDVRLYWDQAVYKRPEQPKPFPWHQDNGYTYIEPQQYLTCWVALTDTAERHGCPWVVPGVHRMGTLKHWWTDLGFQCLDDPPGAVAVPARAGSIVVFSSLTPHLTGPNLTSDVRKTYIVQFAPDGARASRGNPDDAPELEPQNHPERQFLILRDDKAIAP